MAELVVDASVLSAMFLGEKASGQFREIVESEATLYAPLFWRFEVANAVWKTKTIPVDNAKELMEVIWQFPVDSDGTEECAVEGMAIARKYNIAFYDSFYIALAKQKGLPLWTLDEVQAKAAERAGVVLLKAEV